MRRCNRVQKLALSTVSELTGVTEVNGSPTRIMDDFRLAALWVDDGEHCEGTSQSGLLVLRRRAFLFPLYAGRLSTHRSWRRQTAEVKKLPNPKGPPACLLALLRSSMKDSSSGRAASEA